jgi:capsule polysaccharide export protein KpsE/RkpR
VEELDHVVTNNSTSAARRERIFLEERLKEIKQDLDTSSKALSQFSSKTKMIEVTSQAKAMVDAGLKMEEQLATARSELAGLRQVYSRDNVRVRTAAARVDELQRQMEKITGPSQGSGPEGQTNQSPYPSLGALPELGLTYTDLERKVLVEESLWEALTKQYEGAKVQEAKEIPTVRVLDAANLPQRKSSPARTAIIILGFMASLFVASIFVLGENSWRDLNDEDERKKLATEIASSAPRWLQRMWRRPQMK